ncbi:hypothetical protein [Romboutsia lituseburensis]|uniref:hypothetical protein n=1 Tax=Romboutsia lituseburensis TaxID=1537 RepID=UPI00215A3BC3|nr:hypothetical protein [Romboutsia lituseburensis]MCR8745001.1 hypothetical protein [Romboutsia lituseburensis]
MNRYIIIRSDTKSISPPMSKQEAIKKLRQYGKDGISSYIVSNYRNLEFDLLNKTNL